MTETMKFTGERFVPGVVGNIELEHLHRYAIARELAVNKTVLDIACGEGYGSAMLAQVAKRVIGVDASRMAIDHASTKYKNDNLEFRYGLCSEIPLPDASIDLVVSFETIEHHDQHEAMMRELKRVLRPNGVAVISSPERHEYSEVPNTSNPFHIKELYRHEFEVLISRYFTHFRMFGQRITYGSAIFPESGTISIVCHTLEGTQQYSIKGIRRPLYLIALASDTELPLVNSGIFEQPMNETEVVRSWSGLLEERDGQIAKLNGRIADLNQALAIRDSHIEILNQTVAERVALIESIIQSTSWRMTAPARAVGVFVRQFTRHLNDRMAWLLYLYRRTFMVIRHEGWRTFARKAYSRASRWARYRIVALKHRSPVRSITGFSDSNKSKARCLVSFVIPIYDRTDVLRAAIRSALNQTMRDLEVILVTDGSPPETLSVVNEFINNSHVRVFHFPVSSGNAVRARNKGVLEARGKYVAFLDSDDVALPNRLERSLEVLESGRADVVYGGWRAVLDGTRHVDGITHGQIVFSPDCDLEMLRSGCVPCQSTVMVRRELFFKAGFLKPVMQYREDHELWLRLAAAGAKFKSIPEVLVDLRLHAGNNELNFKGYDSRWQSLVQEEWTKPGPIPKKIAFILPGIGISGGVGVVLKHADLLVSRGHDAFVINLGEHGTGAWFSGHRVPVVHVSDKRRYLFENIDMLFATGWNTVEWLDRFEAKRKLYFVQSDERRFFDDPALKRKIGNSYRMNCEFLTEARWIRTMLEKEFSKNAYYVPNGIDTTVFYPDTPLVPKNPTRPRVLLEGPIIVPFKGMDDAYAAVESLDCEIWIVSSAGKPKKNWRCDRFFEAVPFGEMRKIYSSCDIFLKMSRVEGFFGPPLESMACGCAVVVSKVTGWDEYIIDNVNALVVEQADIDGARSAVSQLIRDHALRAILVKAGYETVKNWSWERSLHAMLAVVEGPVLDNSAAAKAQ